jgi:hypothetical protein
VQHTWGDKKEHSTADIKKLQAYRQKVKSDEVEKVWRNKMIGEFKAYLDAQGALVDKFDGDLFRKLVEKVRVVSMVEVEFVFKVAMEMRDILG